MGLSNEQIAEKLRKQAWALYFERVYDTEESPRLVKEINTGDWRKLKTVIAWLRKCPKQGEEPGISHYVNPKQ